MKSFTENWRSLLRASDFLRVIKIKTGLMKFWDVHYDI